jgi:hypothetical protein
VGLMALDRPDVKPRLDHDIYSALKVFAKIDDLAINEWCERVITEAVSKRISDTNLAHAELASLNIFGRGRDSSGKP